MIYKNHIMAASFRLWFISEDTGCLFKLNIVVLPEAIFNKTYELWSSIRVICYWAVAVCIDSVSVQNIEYQNLNYCLTTSDV